MSVTSPLDEFLRGIEQALHVKRRDLEARLAPIEAALSAYRLAAETELVREFSSSHSFTAPRGAVLSRELAAEQLDAAIRQLPELSSQVRARKETTSRVAVEEEASAPPRAQEKTTSPEVAALLPKLLLACETKRIVVIGAFSGRTKTLPEPIGSVTDWIDTVRDGAHAVGNLPQRIRQGRIAGVVVCDQAVQHQHTEPVVQAARTSKVPVGFAGKGGNAGLARALKTIEAQL